MKKTIILVIIITFVISIFFGLRFFYDGSSKTSIEAIEKYRGDKYVNYVIKESKTSDGEIIFYLHYLKNGNKLLGIDYIKKTWKDGNGYTEEE